MLDIGNESNSKALVDIFGAYSTADSSLNGAAVTGGLVNDEPAVENYADVLK